ncbi:MAG: Fe-S oxidoreductase, partial [Pseudomonadota bacterium]
LMLRHRADLLNTQFKNPLGDVSYHVACHLRVQNVGLKTRDVLQLIPDTKVMPIERCAGHDGTYAVKKEFHEVASKIAKPVVRKVEGAKAAYYASDCAMAGHHIHNTMGGDKPPTHPMKLLRMAYGI